MERRVLQAVMAAGLLVAWTAVAYADSAGPEAAPPPVTPAPEAAAPPAADTPATPPEPALPAKTVDQLREEAVQLAKGGDLSGALAALEKLRAEHPDDNAVLADLAVLLNRAGRSADAEAVFKSIPREPPPPEYVAAEEADCLKKLGREKEASELYLRLILAKPDATDSPYADAFVVLHKDAGTLAAARAGLERETAGATPSPAAGNLLKRVRQSQAAALADNGYPEKAVPELESLLAENPADTAIAQDLIAAYSWAGQPSKAADLYKAWFTDREPPDYILAEAVGFYRETGDTATSEALARKGLRQNPDSPSLVTGLAITLAQAGRPDDALGFLRETRTRLESGGQHAPAWLDLADGDLATRLGRHTEALAAYRAAAARNPALPPAWTGIAEAAAQLQLRDEALAALAKAEALAPETPAVELASIETCETLRDSAPALRRVDDFLLKHPAHRDANAARIRILLDLGAVSLAKEHLRQHPEAGLDEETRLSIGGDEAAMNIEWGDSETAERLTRENLQSAARAAPSAATAALIRRSYYDQTVMFREQEKCARPSPPTTPHGQATPGRPRNGRR